jgi:hypothetical protein
MDVPQDVPVTLEDVKHASARSNTFEGCMKGIHPAPDQKTLKVMWETYLQNRALMTVEECAKVIADMHEHVWTYSQVMCYLRNSSYFRG